jgi:hypothetical protein
VDFNRLFTPCPQEVLFLFLSDPPEEAECGLRNYEEHCNHTPYPQAAILEYSYMATVARVVQKVNKHHSTANTRSASQSKNACTCNACTPLDSLI